MAELCHQAVQRWGHAETERIGGKSLSLAACPVPGISRVKAVSEAGSGNLLLLPSPIPLGFSFLFVLLLEQNNLW